MKAMKSFEVAKLPHRVFESTDLLLLLEEYCKEKIAQGYSWRQISREADLGAPNLLQQVLAGKRNLHEGHLENLIRFFDWKDDEAEYVRLLFQLQNTTDAIGRNQIYQQILGLGAMTRIKMIDRDQYDYFSDWIHPVVRELATMAPSRKDAVQWIAMRLDPPQPEERIKASIDLLQRLGLIFPLRDRFKQKDKVVSTPSQARSLLVGNFHRQVLAKAADSIQSVDRERRDLRTVCLSLTKVQQKALRQRMDAFWKEILHMCESNLSTEDTMESMDVCQFSMQYFPYPRESK